MFKGNTDYISQTHAWLDFLVDLFSLPQGLKPFTLPSLSSTLLVSLPYITQGGCRVCAENNGRTLFHEWAHASCFTFIRGPIPAIKWESDAKTATPSTLFNVASSMKWKQKKTEGRSTMFMESTVLIPAVLQICTLVYITISSLMCFY